MKKQIWVRPDQKELLVDCLKLARSNLGGFVGNEAHKMAGRFVIRRIDELLRQIGAVQEE